MLSAFHIESKNLQLDYTLMEGDLSHAFALKNLGVWFTSNLKSNLHCNLVVKTAGQRAAMIRRCFLSKDRKTLFWAFCVFVRPILEYASPVWSPHLVKDIDLVESVQRSFTRYLPGLKGKGYSERLKILTADSLELRRLKCDLALTYSILHNLCDVDTDSFFTVRTGSKTRGHPFKLVIQPVRSDCRKYFFTNRVAGIWNLLPTEVVMARSLPSFKNKLLNCDLAKHVRLA